MENFQHLAIEEQNILCVLAILLTECEQTTLYQLISESRLVNRKKQPMSYRDISNALSSLKRQKLISHNNACRDDVCNVVMSYASKRTEFNSMIGIIKQVNTNYNIHYWAEKTALSNIRIAIFSNDESLLTHSVKEIRDLSPYRQSFVEIYHLCGALDWCRQLSPVVRTFVLQQLIAHNLYNFVAIEKDVLNVFSGKVNDPEAKKYLYNELVIVYLFQGKFTALEALLPKLEEQEMHICVASYYYVCGKVKNAKKHFTAALKEIRKNKMFLPDYYGIFLILHLLEDLSPRNTKTLEKIFAAPKKHALYEKSYVIFRKFYAWLQNERDEVQLNTTDKLQNLDDFFEAFVLTWMDSSKVSKEKVATCVKQLHENDYKWLGQQLQKICGISGELSGDDFRQYDISKRFCQDAPWKNILNQLEEAIEKNSDVKKRLAWFVEPSNNFCTITAREQKQRSDGTWSEGRELQITPEWEEEYFSFQDKRIILAYLENQHHYEYGHWKKVLLAMADHPYVFHKDHLRKVSIEKASPQLLITKKRNSIHMAFMGENNGDAILYRKESDSKISLTKFEKIHREVIQIIGHGGASFPIEAEEHFAPVVENICRQMTVHTYSNEHVRAQHKESDDRIYVRLVPWEHGFRITIVVKPLGKKGPIIEPGEGGEIVVSSIDSQEYQTKRNLKREKKYLKEILDKCPILEEETHYNCEWAINDVEKCLSILLKLRQMNHVVIEWPQGKKIKVHEQIGWDNLQVSVRKKKDWFEISGCVELDDAKVLEMENLLIHIENSQDNFIALSDNEFVLLTSEMRKRLQDLYNITDQSQQQLRVHPLAANILNSSLLGTKDFDANNDWVSQIKRIKRIQQKKRRVPQNLNATLRNYQEQGFAWLARLCEWGVGGCLADDMGLGKTVQALAIILQEAQKGPSLVIAPTSVAMNWQEEAQKFTPDLEVILFASSSKNEELRELGPKNLVVTSYGMLQNRAEVFGAVLWQTVVLDEAQAIKNSYTKRSQAAMQLQANFKLITTGTPIENHLGELWNLFHFINPGFLGSQEAFRKKYITPIEKDNSVEKRQALRNLIGPFILRRLKKDVLKELPPRIENTLYVEMSEDEKGFYEALRQRAVEKIDMLNDNKEKQHFKILAEIMKLRRVCCHPLLVDKNTELSSSKIEVFRDLLWEILENDHRVLVFSQFVQFLHIIRDFLDTQNISYQYLDGSTPQKERQKNVREFQNGVGRVFLISLKAGGMGLNLTAADYVIHMDPWWNPAVEDQAADRAHRLGQTKPVNIYRLVTKDTIEQKILQLHGEKRELAESVLEGRESPGKINLDEILHLLRSA
ncbi:DEAD/DEAH box helicase [Candidatus Uabimicrobium amorphum]|uniref:SWF/SNF family helicase n=1 Tax=Uabimicrobium amorphum TaxID=2596890 RepID=A0A5S9F2R2_UABAM|nr:DEAD/DEAH box helicase [Candidatus Uabimicrobium amorphum]BBM83945.1 SWF/SNF family helicase [Candidatus Uabimicrobium amorphum]